MSTKHTPGPWAWFERKPGRPYLATPDRGQLYVLGFERKGMHGAGPVFAHWPGIEGGATRERMGGVMEPGLLMRDGSMHPDARLIEAAPDLLQALKSARESVNITRACLLDSVETHGTHGGWLDEEQQRLSVAIDEMDAAIAKAEGTS